jgi:hypothetical protein
LTEFLWFPGWGQQTKYLSHELNSSHYTELRQDFRKEWNSYKGTIARMNLNPFCLTISRSFHATNKQFIASSKSDLTSEKGESKNEPETAKSKLKKAVKEYGSTVIIFHVGISLASLGMFYTLVSRQVQVL